jgi:heme-degrading monooxygenase HmoA
MPFISVTRLRIRSLRFLPSFALNFLGTRRQVRNASGFRGGSLLADRAWAFWTMTAWDSQASMRRYMTTGSHKVTMPYLLDWCDEASVVHWEQSDETLPSWVEADRQMRKNGRASKVRHPSTHHANLRYRKPRTIIAGPIKPQKPN